jgi:hypothetical protein
MHTVLCSMSCGSSDLHRYHRRGGRLPDIELFELFRLDLLQLLSWESGDIAVIPPLVAPRDILSNTKRASRTGVNHTTSETDLRG